MTDIGAKSTEDGDYASGVLRIAAVKLAYVTPPHKILHVRESLEVLSGESLLLRGANGSGKSTFLNALVGNLRSILVPVEGDMPRLDHRSRMTEVAEVSCYVSASPQLLPFVRCSTYLHLAATRLRSKTMRDSRIDQVTELFRITRTMLKQTPQTLSTGQRKRVALAATLLLGRKIVVLDEPRDNLDDHGEEKIDELIKMLKDDGKILVIASHRQEDCDHADHFVKCESFEETNELLLLPDQVIREQPKVFELSNPR